jgi:sugar/nucleoside kinase (ribokinase family)
MIDALIVGGLTIDHFADGSLAPGGSVLHASVAIEADDVRLTTLTVAGDEPVARDGLERLRGLGALVHQRVPTTTVYRHEQRDGARVLVCEARAEPIDISGLRDLGRPDVALIAPIADEVASFLVDALCAQLSPRRVVVLVQGWLRRLVEGQDVRPLALDAMSTDQWRVIGDADAIVVSTEDLVEAPGDPFAQAAELRRWAGPKPIIVVTLGTDGYLLDDSAGDRVIASVPRRVVTGVSAVGAGDTFGAALAVNLAREQAPLAAADLAADRVARMLASRR